MGEPQVFKIETAAPTRSLMNKLANRLISKMEVSAQQAYSAILGNPASYKNRSIAYGQIWACIKFRRSMLRTDKLDESDECDKEVAEIQGILDGEDEEGTIVTGEGGAVDLYQVHLNYVYRSTDLAALNLYEYLALIEVKKGDVKEVVQHRRAGRPFNDRFLFDKRHPLYATHVQCFRSKAKIPMLCGSPCPRMPKDPNKDRSAYNKHCMYMATLFMPWDANSSLFRVSKAWGDWVAKQRHGSAHEKARFLCAQNVAKGLSGRGKVADLLNAYRMSCAAVRTGKKATDTVAEEMSDEAVRIAVIQLQQQFGGVGDCEAQHFLENMNVEMSSFLGAMTDNVGLPPDSEIVIDLPPRCTLRAVVQPTPLTFGDNINPTTTCSPSVTTIVIPPSLADPKYEEQRKVFEQCMQMIFSSGPKRQHILIHGGPGTGKSIVSKHIIHEALKLAPNIIVSSATTGIAAWLLSQNNEEIPVQGHPCDTYQSRTSMGPPGTTNRADTIARRSMDFEGVTTLLIDEMSMLSVSNLNQLDEQLRKIVKNGSKKPFGGLSIILVGDGHQLKPVRGTSLFSSPETLADFTLMDLNNQHRAGKDKGHSAMIANLRRPETLRDGLKWLVENVKTLTPQDVDFVDAPVIVVTNRERCTINRTCAIAFAKRNKLPVVAFRLHDEFVDDETMFYFVKGGPAAINETIKTMGLPNGLQCHLDSLSYTNKASRAIVNAAISAALPGEVVIVPVPDTINVKFKEQVFPVPRSAKTMKIERGDLVIEMKEFMVDLGFAFTFHKAQGFTFPRVILQLNKRAHDSGLGRLSLAALYVSVTRVQYTDHIRVFSPSDTGFAHILELKMDEKLLEWFEHKTGKGYLRPNKVKRPCATPPQVRVQKRSAADAAVASSTKRVKPTTKSPPARKTESAKVPFKRCRSPAPVNFSSVEGYDGVKNTGTCCHITSICSALVGVASCFAPLRCTLAGLSEDTQSVLAWVRRLCGLGAEKQAAIFSLASSFGFPAPVGGAVHQCALQVFDLLYPSIPSLKEALQFVETRSYVCPLCNEEFFDVSERYTHTVCVQGASPTVFSFEKEEIDHPREEGWNCSSCGQLILCQTTIVRTVPTILVVPILRMMLNGHRSNAIVNFPLELNTGHVLKAVVKHVDGGTHFVTHLLDVNCVLADGTTARVPCVVVNDGRVRATTHHTSSDDFIGMYVAPSLPPPPFPLPPPPPPPPPPLPPPPPPPSVTREKTKLTQSSIMSFLSKK